MECHTGTQFIENGSQPCLLRTALNKTRERTSMLKERLKKEEEISARHFTPQLENVLQTRDHDHTSK